VKKKVLFPIMALVLALSLALPMTAIVSASPATMTVVSDNTSVLITRVYNKALGVSTLVDLSSSPPNAVKAWEPAPYFATYPDEPPEATGSTWDNGVGWFEDNVSAADWIWETHLAEGPKDYDLSDDLYDADAARYGRVVQFETTFNIPGIPTSATLHIAADNGYEAWVNTGTHYMSPTATVGWETSNLTEAWLTTSGWDTAVGHHNVVVDLQSGSNTLYVMAGNEYFWGDDTGNFDNPTVSTWGEGDYEQHNPGAVIFQLDVEYDIASIEISKTADREYAHEGDIITYNYSVHNNGDVPLGPPIVTDNLSILVSPVLDGHPFNIGDTNDDNVFDPCETWNFTANYTVPWFYDCYTVENTANASAWYGVDVFEVTDESNLVVVDIVRNPDIELTKEGPDSGYFQTFDADYFYSLNNTGDCSLNVTLAIDVRFLDVVPGGYVGYVDLTYVGGDGNGNSYLDPDEVWNYTSEWLLECDPEVEQDRTHFIDIGYVEAEDVKGTDVYACDCWTVIIFQWLPRTIGYWGNWDNHYTEVQFEALLEAAIANSPNIEALDAGNWYGEGDVHDFLLGKPPFKKKDQGKDAFARFIMEKQFLATWLNVKSYMDWVEDEPIPGFIGTGDAAMNPDATVYLTAECMPDGAAGLFAADTLSVEDLLEFIEDNKAGWHAAEFGIAYEVLDIMNNAESNNYCAFIDPDWDPGECPVLI